MKDLPESSPYAVCLMGPTASGKTDLAIRLCERYPFKIISVDSSQVYRGMDIGTAKPDHEVLEKTPHRLIDIRNPGETYSAADFCSDALREMKEITAAGEIPLLVGGTMFYFRALNNGLSSLPPASKLIRQRLDAEAAKVGWPKLHARLEELDSITAARIDKNDGQRIQRALEIFELTGERPSELSVRHKGKSIQYNLIKIVLSPSDRKVLHKKIALRFEQMLSLGLVEEVSKLRANGLLAATMPAARTVGYRQVWQHLDGEIDYSQLVDKGVAATRQLAKRQLTWLRNQSANTWLDSTARGLNSAVYRYISSKFASLGIY